MFIAITLSLFLLTGISLVIIRVLRPDFSYSWPVAVVGSFLAWISTILWQIQLPSRLVVINYTYKDIFNYSLILVADGKNFPYAIGLTSLVLAVIFTSSIQATTINPFGWARLFFLSFLGLLAILSENLLTLVIAWALIDIAGLISSLRAVEESGLSENAVVSYSIRLIGMGFVLWAGILGASNGHAFDFSTVPQGFVSFLLVGVIFRSCSLLIRLPYSKDPSLQPGHDTTYLLILTSANMILLTHLPKEVNYPLVSIFLTIIIALIGLFAIFSWLRSPYESGGQSFWITGLTSLAIAASLRGNPIGSAAWGSSIFFLGGLLFLYSFRNRWLTVLLLIATFSLSALPYSLTATGWISSSAYSWLPLLLLIPLQGLLISGYIRSILHDGGTNLNDQPNWVEVFYPMGLIILLILGLLLGVMGWVGAGQIGAWIPGLIGCVISVILSFILVRNPRSNPIVSQSIHRPMAIAISITSIFWSLFRIISRLLDLISITFEGDGGFLWTILFLVVFISFLRGYIR